MLKHFRSGSKRIRTLWWVLTIGTVVTFIGGFIFIFGSGTGDTSRGCVCWTGRTKSSGGGTLRSRWSTTTRCCPTR